MNVVLLTAAGSATRMRQDIPKQFMHIANRPIIIHTMEKFQNHPQVDAIMVVTLPTWIDFVWAYAKQFNITKLKWVVKGGETGQESIVNGLNLLKQECREDDLVTIHDGNRPAVSPDVISDSYSVCKKHGGAVAAIPCIEAIFRSKDGEMSSESIPREELWRTQTPHTFSLGKCLWAYSEAEKREIRNTTAICTLLAALGEPIFFSKGNEKNIKITTVEDIDIFEAVLMEQEKTWIK